MKFLRSTLLVLFLSAGILSFAEAQQPQDTLRPNVGNSDLRLELLSMRDRDQKIRNDLIGKSSGHSLDSVLLAKMIAIDTANTRRIKEIIHQFGWPGRTLVGQDGAQSVFLIVQHSPDTLFQRSCLSLLQNAFKAGEASGQDLALLTDRVLVREGKRQLYGSQARFVNDKLILDPIEDEATVDKRRDSLGLTPLSEYVKLLKQVYHLKDK